MQRVKIVRLTPAQIELIVNRLGQFLGAKSAEFYLYGSRVGDDLKGGDIDLLLLVENSSDAFTLSLEKHRLVAQWKAALGDRRIDLTVALKGAVSTDPFLKGILEKAILLKRWPRCNE